jgi:hypothetical protein
MRKDLAIERVQALLRVFESDLSDNVMMNRSNANS